MNYFSRLTDIVTCNLTEILSQESDPAAAIEQIIAEMQEGLAGAQRSVSTAAASEERLKRELEEHRSKIDYWTSMAREELAAGNEEQARLALVRKREVEDLIAGLEQQFDAAVATREHLTTTQRALDARLADARRKQHQLKTESTMSVEAEASATAEAVASPEDPRAQEIDAELEALKRELGNVE